MIFIIPTNTCFGIGCFIKDIESYKKIYEIKGRNFKKPMAIFLDSFDKLQKIASLSNDQISFLKNYTKPWTILIDRNKITDKNILQDIENLPNSQEYKKLAFRVAHNFMHWKLIQKGGYFFLTSANKSNKSETKNSTEVREFFNKELQDGILRIFSHPEFIIPGEYYFSDIFEFENNSLKIKFYRKN